MNRLLASFLALFLLVPTLVLAQANPAPLTWDLIQQNSGTLATRQPLKANGTGSAPTTCPCVYGINGFDWQGGGFSYLGDPTRIPNAQRSEYTLWHIIYPEAVSFGGAAKPQAAGGVVYFRNYQAWLHKKSGGWINVTAPAQQTSASNKINTWRTSAVQQGTTGSAQNTGPDANGVFSETAPPIGQANHGWPQARALFAAGQIDGAFGMFDIRVNKDGLNLLVAAGGDWYNPGGSAPSGNTGYSQTKWISLNTNWQTVTDTSMSLDILKRDPPPPLVGIGVVIVPTDPVVIPPITGTQGLKGDKGDTGPAGPKGDKGDVGAAGTSNIEILLNGQPVTGDITIRVK